MTEAQPLVLKGIEPQKLYDMADAVGLLLPRGRVLMVAIAHDHECPCAHGDEPLSACTCKRVDATFEAVE